VAINRRTLDTIRGLRIQLDGRIGYHEQQLIVAWSRAWGELRDEWVAAVDDLVANSTDGKWPTRRHVTRARRARDAFAATSEAMDELITDFQLRALRDVPIFTGMGRDWEARLMAAQLPETEGTVAELAGRFDRVNPRALDAIVERTTENITATSWPIGAQAERALRTVLVRGVSLGQHPSVVARELVGRLEGAFNGGRNRALVIARTELLDAYRAASFGQDQANAKSLRGWQWVSTLDSRTCPSCWSQHGSVHELTEPGPNDHQQGRCVRVPRIRSYRELGIDVDEPADILPDGRATFDALPQETRVAVMGRERLRMLDDGMVGWTDLSKLRTTDGWRDSYVPATTSDLLRIANT
jgi:SPP1 gp7 family putative phage head morphogenesis protein